MKNRMWLIAGVALVAFLTIPQNGDSCGPFIPTMEFTSYHGLLPGDLASGRYGVVRPHFWRHDLLLSYRAFSGVRLANPDDAKETPEPDPQRTQKWLDARAAVPGAPPLTMLQTDRLLPGSDYQSYANCLDDAFASAADTLHKRVAQWGAKSPQVTEWLRGQDAVFENCSTGESIPAALPNAAADLAADRAYQTAAAEFYAQKYDRAEADFDRIATQQASPWHSIAPYLAARACIRHATIGGQQDKLQEAAKRLQAIVKDPARKQWQAAAQNLLDFIQGHVAPEKRLLEAGNELMKPDVGPRLGRLITDYTRLWDHLEDAKDQKVPVEQSDLSRWISTFQHGAEAKVNWGGNRSLPWLVAALVWAPEKDPASADLLRAAHAVPPDSPAYSTVTYYGILRQIRVGELDAARQWADEALGKAKSPSALNLLRSERLRLVRNWQEFLQFATRQQVGTDEGDNSTELLSDDEMKKKPPVLDRDAANSLDMATPLSLWMDAASANALPQDLRGQIVQAGWVRAVLLGDAAAAKTFAARLADAKPPLAAEMKKFAAETDAGAARFDAVFLMLRNPGFEPVVRGGFPRQSPLAERDSFRDNWWTLEIPKKSDDPQTADHEALVDVYGNETPIVPGFLPKDQRAAGEAEFNKLVDRAGNSVNFLCSETIAWANAHPQDPRVPEALHHAVIATHYGQADKASSAFSKQAFDILHKRYPASEWTKQTKYWY
jgi:hypothetical protein